MTITTAMTKVPKPAAHLIDAFREASTSIISDNLERLPGAVGLKPYHRAASWSASPLRSRRGPATIWRSIMRSNWSGPATCLSIDGGGDETRALVGEIMKNIAQHRGAEGYVIDGAIRDVASFADSDFPCYARAVIHRGPYKNGPGEINVPVSIGGSVISPGDIVVGDEDGVVSFPQSDRGDLAGSGQGADRARSRDVERNPRRPLPGQLRQIVKPSAAKGEGTTMSQKAEFHNLDKPDDGLLRELAPGCRRGFLPASRRC